MRAASSASPNRALVEHLAFFAIKGSFTHLTIWLNIAGILLAAASSTLVWLTVEVSVSGSPFVPFSIAQTVIITGQDATWNVWVGVSPLRMIFVQMVSLALAAIALFSTVFRFTSDRRLTSSLLSASGLLGAALPVNFAYVMINQARQLSSQLGPVLEVLKPLGVQLQYSYAIGPGLVLAIASPLLLIVSGILIFRGKPQRIEDGTGMGETSRTTLPQPGRNSRRKNPQLLEKKS